MSKNVNTFTDANFEQEVLQSRVPVLVDFWASWCGPCRAVGPTIDELADQYSSSVKVGKLNIDENPLTPVSFGIQSIPAVLVFQNGQIVDTLIGVQSLEKYSQALSKVLEAPSSQTS